MSDYSPTQAILDYVNKQITTSQFHRALINYQSYWVAANATPEGGAYPAAIEWEGQTAVFVFSSQEEMNKANSQIPAIAATTAVINDVDGAPLFAGTPDHFTRIELDAGSPIALKIKSTEIPEIKKLARAVMVERALANPQDGATFLRMAREFTEYRVAFLADGENWLPLRMNDQDGSPRGLIFTAQDCIDAFVSTAAPGQLPTMMWATLDAGQCFKMMRDLGFGGVVFNVSGPVKPAYFDIRLCDLILDQQ